MERLGILHCSNSPWRFTSQMHLEDLEINLLLVHLLISEEKLYQFKTAIAEDSEVQRVVKIVQSGWPGQVTKIIAEIRKYCTFREELTSSVLA